MIMDTQKWIQPPSEFQNVQLNVPNTFLEAYESQYIEGVCE